MTRSMKSAQRGATTARDMTSGPILRALVLFALPLLLGNVFQMLYNTVDSVIVGNYVSKQALAAVGSTTVIVNLLVLFFNGFSIGASVVIGQSFGAKDLDRLHRAVETTIALTFLLCVIFSLAGVFAVHPLLRLMNTPDDVFRNASTYLRIYFGGMSGLLIYNMGSGILRAVGDSTRPLYFIIFTSIVNIALDFFFVLVLKTGIAGVAVATVLAQSLSAVLVLILLTRTKDIYRLRWRELQLDPVILRRIVVIGLPMAIQTAITSLSNIFVQGYINFFGSDVMAGWACYNRLNDFIFLPIASVSMAGTTFVSQNTGAGNEQRSHRGTVTALILTTAVTAIIVALLYAFAPGAVRLFSSDAAVIAAGVLFIRTNSIFFLFNCNNHVLAGTLRGRGDSLGPMIIMLATFVGVRQVYLYMMTHFVVNTPRVVGFGYPVGWMCCFAAELLYYFLRHRRTARRSEII